MWRTSLLLAVVAVTVALAACAPPAPAPAPPPPPQPLRPAPQLARTAPQPQTITVQSQLNPDETSNSIRKESNEIQLATTTTTMKSTTTPAPVHLRYPSAVLFGRTCGGTIISPTWVLSAGHCTLFTRGRDVLAGTSISDDGSGVRARVKRLIIHPRFSVGPYWLNADKYHIKQVAARFDFLLVELETPLPLDGRSMVAAKLPAAGELAVPPGLRVGYAGYGAEHHGETMRHQMHAMELVTVADEVCSRKLEQYDPHDMLCTTGLPPRNDSACNGDSGSGLMEGSTLLGVASWVEDDATRCFRGAHVVFSRVARVRDWIHQVTGF